MVNCKNMWWIPLLYSMFAWRTSLKPFLFGQFFCCKTAAKFTFLGIPELCEWCTKCFASHPCNAHVHSASARCGNISLLSCVSVTSKYLFALLDFLPHSLNFVIFLGPRGKSHISYARRGLDWRVTWAFSFAVAVLMLWAVTDLLAPFLFGCVPTKGLENSWSTILLLSDSPTPISSHSRTHHATWIKCSFNLPQKKTRKFKTSPPFLMMQDSVTSHILKIAFLKSSASRVSERYFKNYHFIFRIILSISVMFMTWFYPGNGITSGDVFICLTISAGRSCKHMIFFQLQSAISEQAIWIREKTSGIFCPQCLKLFKFHEFLPVVMGVLQSWCLWKRCL